MINDCSRDSEVLDKKEFGSFISFILYIKKGYENRSYCFHFFRPVYEPINGMVLLTVNRLEASLESFAMDRASHEGSREA